MQQVFAGIEFSGRELDHHAAQRITELALQHQLHGTRRAFQQRHHHDSTRMHNVLAGGHAAVG